MEIERIEWFDDRYYRVTKQGETKSIPSVNNRLGIISKPFLARWRGDIGNQEADRRMNDAANRGTRIHDAWYVLTTGGAVLYHPTQGSKLTPERIEAVSKAVDGNVSILWSQDEMFQVYKLQRWLDIVRPKMIASEIMVYDWEREDAGTLDNIMWLPEKDYMIHGAKPLHISEGFYIVDLKTGQNVEDEAWMQTAAYAYCVTSMQETWNKLSGGGKDIAGTIIIHTGSKNVKGIEGIGTHIHNQMEMSKDYQDYRHVSAVWERKHEKDHPKVFDFPTILSMKEI